MMGYSSSVDLTNSFTQFICGTLILLFSYAAFSKLVDISTFEWQMLNQPLPRWIGYVLIWFIPISEIVIVLLLVFKRTQWYGLIASTLLMGVFTIYVAAVVLHFFDRVPCSCGGVLQGMTWEVHLIFNVVVTLIAGVGMRMCSKN